jgi:hypothetical protein
MPELVDVELLVRAFEFQPGFEDIFSSAYLPST